MKALTVAEALITLGNGEKITSDYKVFNESYIQIKDGVICYDGDASDLCINSLGQKLDGENLRIYEEPKKMIKVAKYARFNCGQWENDDYFYKNIEELESKTCTEGDGIEWKRLDYTEIEVEDY